MTNETIMEAEKAVCKMVAMNCNQPLSSIASSLDAETIAGACKFVASRPNRRHVCNTGKTIDGQYFISWLYATGDGRLMVNCRIGSAAVIDSLSAKVRG